jgi:hypothetical protein
MHRLSAPLRVPRKVNLTLNVDFEWVLNPSLLLGPRAYRGLLACWLRKWVKRTEIGRLGIRLGGKLGELGGGIQAESITSCKKGL